MLDDVEIEGEDGGDSEEGGSWWSRANGGARTFSAGFIFLASLFVLFWNESYSKKHADGLAELADQVQSAPTVGINPALDGKPVHLSAQVHSQAGARDPFFGIGTDGAVLYRHVEMFQWIEYEETTGRGRKKKTTYHYEQGWDSEYHDSSQFHEPQGHENPKPALESDGFFAADARFGPYRFDSEEIARQALWDMDNPDELGSLGKWPQHLENLPEVGSELAARRWYQLEPGVYYRGNQASDEPELGDLSVSFYAYANDYPLTVIARQDGEQLSEWRASNGDEILLAAGGTLDARTVVKIAQVQQDSFTRTLRLIGLAGAVIRAAGVASWLGGFLSMIPVVGRLVSVSLAIAGGLFGLMAGLVTIVVGWLAARPWIAALLLIAIGTAVSWAIQKRRKADQAEKRARRRPAATAAAFRRRPRAGREIRLGGKTRGCASAGQGRGQGAPAAPAASRDARGVASAGMDARLDLDQAALGARARRRNPARPGTPGNARGSGASAAPRRARCRPSTRGRAHRDSRLRHGRRAPAGRAHRHPGLRPDRRAPGRGTRAGDPRLRHHRDTARTQADASATAAPRGAAVDSGLRRGRAAPAHRAPVRHRAAARRECAELRPVADGRRQERVPVAGRAGRLVVARHDPAPADSAATRVGAPGGRTRAEERAHRARHQRRLRAQQDRPPAPRRAPGRDLLRAHARRPADQARHPGRGQGGAAAGAVRAYLSRLAPHGCMGKLRRDPTSAIGAKLG